MLSYLYRNYRKKQVIELHLIFYLYNLFFFLYYRMERQGSVPISVTIIIEQRAVIIHCPQHNPIYLQHISLLIHFIYKLCYPLLLYR